MKPCEIAVIVPVHNAAAFLTACTDAIAAQKFDAFRCILVDDGSTDGSPALCDAIAAGDQRFVAMHQPNSGVCAALKARDLTRESFLHRAVMQSKKLSVKKSNYSVLQIRPDSGNTA